MDGFITIPWSDEYGRPLTMYGRFAGDSPLMKDRSGWKKKREELRLAWEKNARGKPWEEPRVPKTFALPGPNSKCAPLYLDRALQAGHKEVALVEGVLDALVLQAHGETRAIASVAAQLSGEQVKTLVRARIKRVYVCGDPDGGGDDGNIRNVIFLANAGITSAVAPRLPEGVDPDEYVIAHGIDAWRELVKRSNHGYRHLAEVVIAKHGERRVSDDFWADDLHRKALEQAMELPEDRPDLLTTYYFPAIGNATGATSEDLREMFRCRRIDNAGRCASASGDAAAADRAGEQQGEDDGAYKPEWISTRELQSRDWRPEWHVKNIIVANEPLVVGAPKKTMKTSLMIDLACSLATGVPFLGVYAVPRPFRVVMLSGESGGYATSDTVRRVCDAKGIDPASMDCMWGFRLPQLAVPTELARLKEALKGAQREVLIIDPLYLSLLAGQTDLKASNLYDMGPLLLNIANVCRAVGTTPILVHHAVKQLKPGEAMELEHLSYSGVAEFARQWILINRRKAYDPSSTKHELWMSWGGSVGHAGSAAIDVDVGKLAEDFKGRRWEVMVTAGGEAVKQEKDAKVVAKEEKKAKQLKDDCSLLLAALDSLDPDRQGFSKEQVRIASGIARSSDRFPAAILSLVRERIVEEMIVQVATGRGKKATRPAEGIRRRPVVENCECLPKA